MRSQPGEGTTFEIAWPTSHTPVCHPSHASEKTPPWRASGRALVVDDNAEVRATVARLLSELGFEATQTSSPEEGIAMFRSATPPFVLAVVDQTMPGLSGSETIAELQGIAPALPAVLMSGYPAKTLTLSNEHVTFLQKPMTVDQLRCAVRKVLPL